MNPEEETIWRFLRGTAMDVPDFGTDLLRVYLWDASHRRALTERENRYLRILTEELDLRLDLAGMRREMVRQAELEAASQG